MSTAANLPRTTEPHSAAFTTRGLESSRTGTSGITVTTGDVTTEDETSPALQLILLALLMSGLWLLCEFAGGLASEITLPSPSEVVHGLGVPMPPLFR